MSQLVSAGVVSQWSKWSPCTKNETGTWILLTVSSISELSWSFVPLVAFPAVWPVDDDGPLLDTFMSAVVLLTPPLILSSVLHLQVFARNLLGKLANGQSQIVTVCARSLQRGWSRGLLWPLQRLSLLTSLSLFSLDKNRGSSAFQCFSCGLVETCDFFHFQILLSTFLAWLVQSS